MQPSLTTCTYAHRTSLTSTMALEQHESSIPSIKRNVGALLPLARLARFLQALRQDPTRLAISHLSSAEGSWQGDSPPKAALSAANSLAREFPRAGQGNRGEEKKKRKERENLLTVSADCAELPAHFACERLALQSHARCTAAPEHLLAYNQESAHSHTINLLILHI